ncbi:tRNA pseudouridine(38,39,40) synthase TruA [Humibacillus sp. DSM 29435]|nr:tRNA pseudouridine(38,39,40) synthase TruA [Humibacillus sp. DSM 29435]
MQPSPGAFVRLRLDLAYDGTDFAGWAPQPRLRTVYGDLSAALTTVLRQPRPVRLTVAGRTDAGVHAKGQVAHVDVPESALATLPGRSDRAPEAALATRLRGILKHDLVVYEVTRAPVGFDARFSALERRYRYRLADPDAVRDPLRRRDTVWWRRRLDVDSMNHAARSLEGLGDFAAFCKRREGATTIRTLVEFSWERRTDGVLEATVRADAFCHSMVRSLVGAVVRVGEGLRDPDWPAGLQRERQRGGPGGGLGGGALVVPALGLVLDEVLYPADSEVAERSRLTRVRRHVSELA